MAGQNKKKSIAPVPVDPTSLTGAREESFLLEKVLERFIHSFRMSYSRQLGKVLQLNCVSEEFSTYEEYMQVIPYSSLIGVLAHRGPLSVMLVVLDSKICYGILESSYGGRDLKNQMPENVTEREYTKVELSLFRGTFDLLAREFSRAWKDIYPVEMKLVKVEQNSQLVNVSWPTQRMMIVHFSLEEEGVNGGFSLAFPCSGIDLIKQKQKQKQKLLKNKISTE